MALERSRTFADLLREYRRAAEMTQEHLAERSGLSVRALRKLESGTSQTPRRDTMSLLATALGLARHDRMLLEASVTRHRKSPSAADESSAPLASSPALRPTPALVGRVSELAVLERHLRGEGSPVLLLAGEPGIGKTRLLAEAALRARQQGWTVLEGRCTRRSGQEPYAPLVGALAHFIAARPPTGLRADLEGCAWLVHLLPELAERAVVPAPTWSLAPAQVRRLMFAAVARYLANVSGPAGTLLLLDDVQWASASALALLATLIEATSVRPLQVVGAYRSTEVHPGDHFDELLADLARKGLVEPLALGPLTPAEARLLLRALLAHPTLLAADQGEPVNPVKGVAQLERLVQRTGSVPFFLVSCAQGFRSGVFGELSAAEAGGVPWTVAQTIRRRMTALPEAAQEILNVAAVLGRSVPGALLAQVMRRPEEEVLAGLEHACHAHLLVEIEEDTYQLAHDLIQEVIMSELTGRRRKLLHQRVAEALEGEPGETPVELLAYHYERSGNREKAVHYLERAGDRASAVYAHTEAASHYRMALRSATVLDPNAEHRARLLDRLADECLLTSQLAEAIQAQEAALAIWQARDQQARVGHNLRNLSRLHWLLGHRAETDRCADQAIAVLRALPPSVELARAYSNKAHMSLLRDDDTAAVHWGRRAIVLAQQLGDVETLCHSLTTVGSVPIFAGTKHGRARVERSLQLALEHGFDEQATRAYCNLAEQAVWARTYARATQYLADGMTHCLTHDVALAGLFLHAMRARARLDQGDWPGAEEDATAVQRGAPAMVAARIPALVVLGYLRARRGNQEVWAALDEARDLARTLDEPNRIMLVAAARAEAAWLEGEVDRCRVEAQVGFDLEPAGRGVSWCFGELAFWLWRSGGLAEAPRTAAEPFARHIAGDWRAAAALWERIGCPYERALALADGDEPAQRAALSLVEGLGADPEAERVRRTIHSA